MGDSYDIGYPGDSGEVNPAIIQGATFQLPFTVTNVFANDGIGCTLTGKVFIGTAAGVEFTGEILGVDPATLACRLLIGASVTAAMQLGTGYYTTKLTDSSGFVLEPLQGRAKVTL